MPVRCLLSVTSGRLYPYGDDQTLAAHRRRLLARAEGRVLDISERWQDNLPCYRRAQVTSLTVLSRPAARRQAWSSRLPAWPAALAPWSALPAWSTDTTQPLRATPSSPMLTPDVVEVANEIDGLFPDIPFGGGADDRLFETVVSSMTLCTVASLAATLDAVGHWLAPGGQLLALEHVLGTGITGLVQAALTPTRWRAIGGARTGCRLDQDLPEALRAAGLLLSDCARFTSLIGGTIPVPCLAGVARVSAA